MGNSRPRQKLLPEKLLAIRRFLNLGQVEFASELQTQLLVHCGQQSHIHRLAFRNMRMESANQIYSY